MAPFAEARGGSVARRSYTHKRDWSDDNRRHSGGKAFRDNDNDYDDHGGNDGYGRGGYGGGRNRGDSNGYGNNIGSHGIGNSGDIPGEGIAGAPAIAPTITTATVVAPAPVTTTSISTTSTFDPGSDSNGAQRLSSDSPPGVTTTPIPTPAPTTLAIISSPTSTSVILTTSTIATTGPNVVVTSFIPVVTTSAVVKSTTTIISIAIGQAGAFRSDFSGFSDLPQPTNKGDANSDGADGTYKESHNTTSSATGEKHNDKSKPLSPAAERALISVGSIGAFVIVCAIFWLVWRAMRKHKQKKSSAQGNMSSSDTSDSPFAAVSRFTDRAYGKVASKVPFFSTKRKTWHNLEETSSLASARGTAPMSMVTNNLGPSTTGRTASPIDMSPVDRVAYTTQTFDFGNITANSSPPPSIPQQVYYPDGVGIQFLPVSEQSPPQGLEAGYVSPNGGAGIANPGVSSFSSASQPMAPAVYLQQAVHTHTRSSSSMSSITMKQPAALRPEQHQLLAQQQLAPNEAISISTDTMRSRMPDPYYNQSQLARQPSDAYDPTRREVNRASELSSLSSGFGDGEMMMLMPEQRQIEKAEMIAPGALPLPIAIPAEPMSSKGQFSWMRNTRRMTGGTVNSEASDDQPTRFRTLDSWVKQQMGRVRRGQASIDATTDASAGDASGIKLMPGHEPGIPHPLPEEQRLTMMMDDGEVPRRPDTLLVNGLILPPPVPK